MPRRDSNPNKQNQNLRCYHYTTRQSPFFSDWRGRRGSNPQPPDRQSSALTNCATTPLLRKVMCSIAYFPAPAQGGVFDFSCGRDLAPPLRGNRWPLATPTDPNRLYLTLCDSNRPYPASSPSPDPLDRPRITRSKSDGLRDAPRASTDGLARFLSDKLRSRSRASIGRTHIRNPLARFPTDGLRPH